MNSAYQQLSEHFEQIFNLRHLSSICGWDQATMMPTGSNRARSAAMAELSVLIHQRLTDTRLEEWINRAAEEPLSADQQANLREISRCWQQNQLLPASLVQAQSLASSECEHGWREQRHNNDWTGFAASLEKVVRLSREEASIRAADSGGSRYDSLLDLFEPGMTSATLDSLFGDLRGWLPGLIQQATERQHARPLTRPQGPFSIDLQKQLGLRVMKWLGFDFDRGRLDISMHPFCGGVPEDVRITTRYDETDFSSALMGVIHETGHARYEQNLPTEWLSQPVGEARSVAIHESQSLFFEMQLARDPAFIDFIHPLLTELFERRDDPSFSRENLLKLYREVSPGLIRVDADEVTYPAHIILRYQLERDLINGDMEVRDIPEFWDQSMQQLLGLSTRDNYRDGCMQDIHWPSGTFGYFPSYTLGAMYAAQFRAAAEQELGSISQLIAGGDPTPLFDWLRSRIWQQGCLRGTDTLVREATGEALNPRWFRQHLQQRYLEQ